MIIIQHQELASSQASITFNSIPQDYTDLYLVCHLASTGSDLWASMTCNGSTSFNYFEMYVENSTVYNGAGNNTNPRMLTKGNRPANGFTTITATILNYSSNKTKSVLYESTEPSTTSLAYRTIGSAATIFTAPITSVTLNMWTYNLAQYSSATLYGIKKA